MRVVFFVVCTFLHNYVKIMLYYPEIKDGRNSSFSVNSFYISVDYCLMNPTHAYILNGAYVCAFSDFASYRKRYYGN